MLRFVKMFLDELRFLLSERNGIQCRTLGENVITEVL